MQALKFIDLLDTQDLLSPEILQELRRQAADSQSRLTPELVASLLVDSGHLTRFQASKALSDLAAITTAQDPKPNPAAGQVAPQPPAVDLPPKDTAPKVATSKPTVAAVADGSSAKASNLSKSQGVNDDLGFDEEPLAPGPDNRPEPPQEIDEVQAVEVVAEEAQIVEVAEVEPIEIVSAVVEPAPKKARKKSASTKPSIAPRPSANAATGPKENPWDSFRIMGVALIVVILAIPGVLLVRHFWVGNAEDLLKRANEAYQAKNYDPAIDFYTSFTNNFTSDQNLPFAKVRLALARVRKEIDQASDPNIALKLAKELLPKVVSDNKEAIAREQSDLATVLLNLAGKFNARADHARSTEESKALMASMEELMAMINDPMYISANERKQQAPTMQRVSEDRQRILRDIEREEELVRAVEAMAGKLKDKDTVAAYEIRRELIQKFPQVEPDSRLVAKVDEATTIQRSLVTTANLQTTLSTEPANAPNKSLVLARCSGGTAPDLAGHVLHFRAKNSLYCIEGESGKVLWLQHFPEGLPADPIRLPDSGTSDILLPQTTRLQRFAGATGQLQWRVDFPTPIHRPYCDGEELYVATLDGHVACLDAVSGQTKWVSKLPQSIQAPPGSGAGKSNLYVLGETSNLYILSRTDGSCKQVYYMGQRPGAIAVPVLHSLGLLFVFENRGDHALVRILKTSAEGLDLADAQNPYRLKGSIVTPPATERNRVFIASDLGEIAVLDIELGSEKDKVSRFDPVPASKSSPQAAQLVTGNNRLWTAEGMLVRWDLLVSRGKLERVWVKDNGDQFIAKPIIQGETIVHSRAMKGSAAVRIAAVRGETGDPLWTTDVGSPVVSLTSTGKAEAINASGMLFALDPSKPLQMSPVTFPGEGKPQMTFGQPTVLGNGQMVHLNQADPSQMAIYGAKDNARLRFLAANFSAGQPTCAPTACKDQFAVGLDDGRLVMIDPINGSLAVPAYQANPPASGRMVWNQPVFLSESNTLIAAHNGNQLLKLQVGSSLQPVTEVPLESTLRGPLSRLGQLVYAIEANGSSDKLVAFDIEKLQKQSPQDLPGSAIAGPYAVGKMVIVQCPQHLCAYSETNQPLWTIELTAAPLVGPPSVAGNAMVIASVDGRIWEIGNDGAIKGTFNTNQPLTSAPRVIPKGMLIGSGEGSVLQIALPLPQVQN